MKNANDILNQILKKLIVLRLESSAKQQVKDGGNRNAHSPEISQ